MGYLSRETTPKALTGGNDIGKGEVGISHFNAPLFLELQFIKLHNHSGVDSVQLRASATPEMVKGYRPSEREEHGVAAWSGAAATNGSVVLTFGAAFTEAPEVFAIAQDGNASIVVGTGVPTTTGVTIYWRDWTGTNHTTMNLAWVAKGR